jgi:hypothetical protein
MKPLPVKLVALLLLVLSVLGIASFFVPAVQAQLQYPYVMVLRYVGMLSAGIGLWLMFKWGLYVYLGSWALQVLLFFLVYGGVSQMGSPLIAVFGPIIVCVSVLPYWMHLK